MSDKSDIKKDKAKAHRTLSEKKRDQARANVLEALERSGGHVQKACIAAKISRNTFYEWMKNDQNFRESAMAIIDHKIDNVEFALYSTAIKGNVTAQIFYLKNKHPSNWQDVSKVDAQVGVVDVRATKAEIAEVIEKYGLLSLP